MIAGSVRPSVVEATQAMRYPVLTLFALAFGVEEAIIVIYLRLLPGAQNGTNVGGVVGQMLPHTAYDLEFVRELSTLVVLASVAWLAGTRAAERLRSFLFAFGIWDIVYYVSLWVLSGQPAITSDDVLFLVPVAWVAPVWAAMAFAAALALLGLCGIAQRRVTWLVTGLCLGWLSFVYQPSHSYPIWLFALSFACVVSAVPLRSIPSLVRR